MKKTLEEVIIEKLEEAKSFYVKNFKYDVYVFLQELVEEFEYEERSRRIFR